MPKTTHTLKVTLRDVRPAVWRLVEVPSDMTLDKLSGTFEMAMGWDGYHLHVFTVGGTRYWPTSHDDWFGDYEDESRYQVCEILPRRGAEMVWEYDLGDGWNHAIVVQSIDPADPEVVLPRCVDASGVCPPEDCGGPWGYADLVAARRDATHPRHSEAVERLH